MLAGKWEVNGRRNRADLQPLPGSAGDIENAMVRRASEGIGLNTVRVSVFAYYDHDITGELEGIRFVDWEDAVHLRFVPEGISREQR